MSIDIATLKSRSDVNQGHCKMVPFARLVIVLISIL